METAVINGAAPSSRHGQVRPPMEALPPAVDVLVVCCGPVGATVANLLARHGVKVMVVDRSTEVFMAPRAIALDNEALREHAPAAAFARAGGRIVQITHRGQRLHLGARRVGRCSPA